MKLEQMQAIFTLAGIEVINWWKLANEYWPEDPQFYAIRENSPWWLVKTSRGLIRIGWRKRVISINWEDTLISAPLLTEDSVTKSSYYIHADSEMKAVEYLKALRGYFY